METRERIMLGLRAEIRSGGFGRGQLDRGAWTQLLSPFHHDLVTRDKTLEDLRLPPPPPRPTPPAPPRRLPLAPPATRALPPARPPAVRPLRPTKKKGGLAVWARRGVGGDGGWGQPLGGGRR